MRLFPSLVVVVVLVSGRSGAEVLTFRNGESPNASYQGSHAVTIGSNSLEPNRPDTNYRNVDLWVGGIPVKQSALMRWDLSDIPLGSTVNAVSITVGALGSTGWEFPIFQCLRPWSNSQATWQQYASGLAWGTAGAQQLGMDHGTAVLGMLAGSGSSTTVLLNAAGVAVVQAWVDGSQANNGFVVQDYSRYYALHWPHSGASVAAQRPRLQVNYTLGAAFTANFQNGVSPSVAYSGNRDTTLADGPDSTLVNRNYKGLNLGGGSNSAAIVIGFDVSTIPSAALVQAVNLELDAHFGGADAYPVYAMLRPWVDATATWFSSDGSTAWATAGAAGATDRATTLLGSVSSSIQGTTNIALNAAGVSVVQGWVSNPSTNRGLIISDYSKTAPLQFEDDEGVVGKRPKLTITYTIADAGGLGSSGSGGGGGGPAVDGGMTGNGPRAVLTPASQELDPGTVTLDGSGSMPGAVGTLAVYRWSQPEGPTGVALASASSQRITLTEPGDYVFRLQVEDSLGARSVAVEARVKIRGKVLTPTSIGCGCAAGGSPLFFLLAVFGWVRFRGNHKV